MRELECADKPEICVVNNPLEADTREFDLDEKLYVLS